MTARPERRLGIISSQAVSLHNFRGSLIRSLTDQGVRVFALAPDFDELSRARVKACGAEPVAYSLARAGLNPLRDFADTISLAFRLRRLRLDMTLGYFIKPVIYGTFAAVAGGVGRRFAMVEGLGYVFTPAADKETVYRRALRWTVSRMYRLAFARCERVIFLNDDDAAWFASKKWVSPGKILRIDGIGLDLAQWTPAPLPPPQPVVFLLIARLLREKGIRDYADAARAVRATHSNTRFMLVGEVDSNPGSLTRREVEGWMEEGVLEWAGYADDVREWIALAHVYVLPSYREGLPRSTQEAMAMARPVITTDAPGCRETVVEGTNGFLVPVRNPAALAAAMLRFVENPALIEPMGRESRRIAEERFDVHKVNQVLIDAMQL